jgi:LysM repeat protein
MPFRMLSCALAAAIALVLVFGCQTRYDQSAANRPHWTPPPPAVHIVREGETISSIARDYGVDILVVIQANDLATRQLVPGERIQIPGGHEPVAPVPAAPAPPAPSGPPVTDRAIDGGPASSPSDWYVPRSAWAVAPVVLSRTTPMGGVPTRITVHHSGNVHDAEMDPETWLRQVDHNHQLGLDKAEPWACIGYHFIIAADGRVFEGRPLAYQGAHAGWDAVNRLNIGICLLGDFDVEHVPAAQRDSLIRVLDRLCRADHIPHSHVSGHNHFKTTQCPGRYLSAIVHRYAGASDGTQDDPTPNW